MEHVLQQAEELARQGHCARAAEICARALRSNPSDPGLLEALANYLERAGFENEALEKLYDLHRLNPSVRERLVDLALKSAGRTWPRPCSKTLST